jgi:sugar phosphate isomerase/epimerase
LKLVFDTGNPVFTDDYSSAKPYPKQSTWEFYSHVKQHIAYIHIKDGVWDQKSEQMKDTVPGEGEGSVGEIIRDLLAGGYDGGISIEPHMSVVFHDESVTSSDEQRYNNYVEYGRRMNEIITGIKKNLH